MRNPILLLSTAFLLAACADDQHTTAPASRSSLSSRSAAGDVSPGGPGAPAARPIDQTGFTSVIQVTSPTQSVDGVSLQANWVTATCPAGSTLVAGGYVIESNIPSARVFQNLKYPNANGWLVAVWNTSIYPLTFHATAMCLQ